MNILVRRELFLSSTRLLKTQEKQEKPGVKITDDANSPAASSINNSTHLRTAKIPVNISSSLAWALVLERWNVLSFLFGKENFRLMLVRIVLYFMSHGIKESTRYRGGKTVLQTVTMEDKTKFQIDAYVLCKIDSYVWVGISNFYALHFSRFFVTAIYLGFYREDLSLRARRQETIICGDKANLWNETLSETEFRVIK